MIGVQATWDDVTRPVLAAVAQRWADTGAGIEIEHLLSDCVTAVLNAAATTAPVRAARPVLLAGMAGDQTAFPWSCSPRHSPSGACPAGRWGPTCLRQH